MAFASVAPLNTDIFIAAGDGSDARPLLAHPDLDYNASFSPDGRSLVFASTRNGSADIYRVGIDGAGLQRLTDHPAFDDQAVFSPNGRLLAFVSSRSGQADIWILDLATGALRHVTNHPGGETSVRHGRRTVSGLRSHPTAIQRNRSSLSLLFRQPTSTLFGPMVQDCDVSLQTGRSAIRFNRSANRGSSRRLSHCGATAR